MMLFSASRAESLRVCVGVLHHYFIFFLCVGVIHKACLMDYPHAYARANLCCSGRTWMKPRVKTSGSPSSSCSTSSRSSTFLNTISPAPRSRVGHQRPPAPNCKKRARHTALGTARTSPDRGVLRRHVLEPFLQVAVDDTLHQARQQARHGPAQGGRPGCLSVSREGVGNGENHSRRGDHRCSAAMHLPHVHSLRKFLPLPPSQNPSSSPHHTLAASLSVFVC